MYNPETELNTEEKEPNIQEYPNQEGRILNDLKFRKITNTKAKVSYKSSAPDRKIIILTPDSELVDLERGYTVVILHDSKPYDANSGRLLAKIVPDHFNAAQASELFDQERVKLVQSKVETNLNDEERSRLGNLVEKCIDLEVWEELSFYYEDEDEDEDDYYGGDEDDFWHDEDHHIRQYRRQERKEEREVSREASRAAFYQKARVVINLRKQIRAEGSKLVSFLIEKSQAEPSLSGQKNYADILALVAGEDDVKRILNLYSQDKAVPAVTLSIKFALFNMLMRLANAEQVDAISKLWDKVYLLERKAQKQRSPQVDAMLFLGALDHIRDRTSEKKDLEKIELVKRNIKNAVRVEGRPEIQYSPTPLEDLREDYETKFVHLEAREAMGEFRERIVYEFLDENEEQVDERIRKMVAVLENCHENFDSQKFFQSVHWNLLNNYSGNNLEEKAVRMMGIIEKLTGVAPDYSALSTKIQREYSDIFGSRAKQSADKIRSLYVRSGIRLKAEQTEIRAGFKKILLDSANSYENIKKQMDLLQEISGVKFESKDIEQEIHSHYNKILENAVTYKKPTWFDNTHDLATLETIYDITGLSPKFSPDRLQKRSRSWMVRLEPTIVLKFWEVLKRVVDFEPNFVGEEDTVRTMYESLWEDIQSSDILEHRRILIAELERVTKIKPVFPAEEVQSKYTDLLLRFHNSDLIEKLQELTGVMPDYEKNRYKIKKYYLELLTKYNPLSFEANLTTVRQIKEISGINLDFDSTTLGNIFIRAERMFVSNQNYKPIAELVELLGSTSGVSKLSTKLRLACVSRQDLSGLLALSEVLKVPHSEVVKEDVVEFLEQKIFYDISHALDFVKFIFEHTEQDEFVAALGEIYENNVWAKTLLRLEKLQRVSKNADNDPWKTELLPLLRNLVAENVIAMEEESDANILVSFVEQVGMKNLPALFEFYADCMKNKNPDDLSSKSVTLLKQFGVRVRNANDSLRFTSSLELFNELNKGLKTLRTDLLSDKIPEVLGTELGEELFMKLKGKTQFEREEHSLTNLIETWNSTIEANPELNTLPLGFKEQTFKAPNLRAGSVEKTVDVEEAEAKLLASQEVKDVYFPLAQTWEIAGNLNIKYWFNEVVARFKTEHEKVKESLLRTSEEWTSLIGQEPDEKQKQILNKKFRALQNPMGRAGMEKQAEALGNLLLEIENIKEVLVNSSLLDIDYVRALESLVQLDGKTSLDKEIRELSAFHMLNSTMGPGWRELIKINFSENILEVTPEKIDAAYQVSKSYVEEHYLHHLQEPSHTEHAAFSEQLMNKLNTVWQQQLDKDTGYLPITVLKNRLDKMLGQKSGESQKETTVSMIPVAGLLNIYSGDLGDSCHTSQHSSIAEGNYPDLRTWVYATNRGKTNEELRGSVLAIQAKTPLNHRVLVVRANNPAENFIQSLDEEAFVVGMLTTAIDNARRGWEERKKANPEDKIALFQKVGIPMDTRGQASTNRQKINDVYRRRFINCQKIFLQDTYETNFNGYNIWYADGYTPSVVIWEKLPGGEEVWHGDWKPYERKK